MKSTGDFACPEPEALSPGPSGPSGILLCALRYPFTGPGTAVLAVLSLLGATLWTDRLSQLLSLFFMAQAACVARGGAAGMPSLPGRDEVRDAFGLWGRAVGALIILVAPVWLFLAVLHFQEIGWDLELPGVDLAGDLGITGLVVAPFWILFWTPIVVAAVALGDSVLFVYLPGRLRRVYRDLGDWVLHSVGATWLGGIAIVAIASAVLPKAGIVNDVGSRALISYWQLFVGYVVGASLREAGRDKVRKARKAARAEAARIGEDSADGPGDRREDDPEPAQSGG